ncbi:hypothetical protein HED60_09305 [Planctomycetales bacterium ZRK34]|nr:hypothetical protein HED60_09305 [Planctomycetales bacterium ZRK34]
MSHWSLVNVVRFVSALTIAGSVTASTAFAGTFIPGDANNDRYVNIADLSVLSSHYGLSSGATQADGDFNGDGVVNIADLSMLSANYGKSAQPVFESSVAPGGTIDFGDVPIGSFETYVLTISNTTTNVVAGYESASDLTLIDAVFGGLTPQFFSIDNFTPGMTIAAGASIDLTLRVAPTVAGPVEGTLTLVTDQGAGLGVAGASFDYVLLDDAIVPTAVPAPSSAIGGMALLLLAGLSKRRLLGA